MNHHQASNDNSSHPTGPWYRLLFGLGVMLMVMAGAGLIFVAYTDYMASGTYASASADLLAELDATTSSLLRWACAAFVGSLGLLFLARIARRHGH